MFKHTQKIGFDTLSSYFGKFAFRVNILYLVLTEDQTFPWMQVIAKKKISLTCPIMGELT